MGVVRCFFSAANTRFILRTFLPLSGRVNPNRMVWVGNDRLEGSDILPETDVPQSQALARQAGTQVEYLSSLRILSRTTHIRLSGIVCITGWRKGAGSSNTVRILETK